MTHEDQISDAMFRALAKRTLDSKAVAAFMLVLFEGRVTDALVALPAYAPNNSLRDFLRAVRDELRAVLEEESAGQQRLAMPAPPKSATAPKLRVVKGGR